MPEPTAPMIVPDVQLDRITRRFGATVAIDDVSLAVRQGEFLTLLGPSGCGKTTLLRVIGGFVDPDAGVVHIQGQAMGTTPPHRRPTAMVFQRYALFPHLTVAANIGYGLRMHGLPRHDVASRVSSILAMVDLDGFDDRLPEQLSGGQQQRVALARALVLQPAVLLLDEPLGALDLGLRRQMQGELKQLQQRTGITFISVTHDQEEALAMSDRIAVMNQGRIEQLDTPEAIFDRPQTPFVAGFMGAQVLTATVTGGDGASTTVTIGPHTLILPIPVSPQPSTLTLAVRPERVRIGKQDDWPATVVATEFKGAVTTMHLRLDDDISIRADIPHDGLHAIPAAGCTTRVHIAPDDLVPLA